MRRNHFSLRKFEKIFLHQMALFIQPPVTTTLKFSSSSERDGCFPAIFIDIVDQILAVIASVREHSISVYIYMLSYRNGAIDVIKLSFTKHHIDRIAISVYGRMDLGVPPRLCPISFEEPPFFAPTLCW